MAGRRCSSSSLRLTLKHKPQIDDELGLAVRPGEYDHEPVGIANPNLLVLGLQVNVRFLNDLRLQRARSPNGGVKIVHFEPQQDSVARWYRTPVSQVR